MSIEKTRIPLPNSSKLASLKLQASTSVTAALPRKVLGPLPSNGLNVGLKRRSKSYTDLSSITNFKPLDGLRKKIDPKPTVNLTTGPPAAKKLRRSVSTSQISRTNVKSVNLKKLAVKKPVVMKPTNVTNNTQQTKVFKRAADTKVTEEVKPKVSKPARIPPYDYKARFNALTEKYTNLQTMYKEAKDKLTDNESIKENYQDLFNKHSILQCDMEKKIGENKIINSEKNILLSKVDSLVNDIQVLEKKYKEVCDAHEILNSDFKQLSEDYKNVSNENLDLKSKLGSAMSQIEQLQNAVDSYKAYLWKNGETLRSMHNTIQDLKGKIRVICRVRPASQTEQESLLCNISFLDECTIEIRKNKESLSISGKPTDAKLEFTFDKVFGPESTQKEVFEDLAHLVQSALDGYHICVFAYGQTGSGKTYTMQGGDSDESKGMIPLAVERIFYAIKHLQCQGWSYTIQASFLEIYNETIKDLLDPKSKESLDIQHNDGKSIGVKNLTILDVNCAEDLMDLMQLANKNRAVAATNFNEHSSRSHAVTKIYIQGVQEDSSIILCGSLNLVDLAGSESAKTSERLTETKNINKSLSTLGQVMLALHNKDAHIPYRNSKLTHLLQNCLGGNSKTLMFVNISPMEECYSESVNSLRFASKVKEVKVNAKRNKTYSKMDASSNSLKFS
ncbi:protein claret segregational-like [Agrilus planipennis]|uniref:Kinesin-like protein n=1 Tax=Agrilus planipennis TaxID=224129 RepID=A0A1W4WUD5_AGRPL|nr:protein claret segregational-like [Agrilus planipennis]